MTALFAWPAKPAYVSPKVGDTRIVQRFLLLPKLISGEWRWLGVERFLEEAYMGWCAPPEMKGWPCIKFRPVKWLESGTPPVTHEVK